MKILRIFSYLGSFATLIVTLLVLVKFYSTNKKQSLKNKFFILSLLSFIDSFLVTILTRLPFKLETAYLNFSEYFHPIYVFIEFNIFSIFYINILMRTKTISIKKFVAWGIAFLTLLFSSFLIIENKFNIYYSLISVLELILINALSAIIFFKESKYENYKLKKSEKLISIGIFLFANFTMPYYIFSDSLHADATKITSALNFFNDFGYLVLYLFILKSINYQK